ncbi:MAG: hypothetical protein CW716_12060 [Candidatus Bathyarchaeum sp.]|nr:MAG: hypothetical protein CW716_12060 [Candidatus Bathyarchaeum sp.]
MNKYLKASFFFTFLAVVALFADFVALQHSPSPQTSLLDPHQIPSDRFNFNIEEYSASVWDIELFYKVKTMLSTINATLLVLLLATYIDLYRKLKSEFTLGLILFSLILLLYAISSNPLLQQFFGYWGIGLGPFAMLPDLFTTFALVVLLYLTMK